MSNEQKITQNEAVLIGKLKEKNITIEPNAEGVLVAKGSVTVVVQQGNEISEVKANVHQKELTNKGTENALFKGIQTVVNTYKSIKEVGEENADIIRVIGELEDRAYFNTNSNSFIEKTEIKATFFKRVTGEEAQEQKCEVQLVAYLNKLNQASNGDLEVELVGLCYNGVAGVYKTIVPADKAVAFQINFKTGVTAFYVVQNINKVEIKEEIIRSDFGSDIVNKIVKTESKLIITNGAIDSQNPLTKEEVERALTLRANNLENNKQKALQKANGQGTMNSQMTAGGFAMPTGNMGMNTQNPTFMPPMQTNFGHPSM